MDRRRKRLPGGVAQPSDRLVPCRIDGQRVAVPQAAAPPEAAATGSPLSWRDDIAACFGPFLTLGELPAAVPVSRGWRTGLVVHVVFSGGLRALLAGACGRELEALSRKISHMAVDSACFVPSRYTLPLLVCVTDCSDSIARALQVFRGFPTVLSLPPLPLPSTAAADGGEARADAAARMGTAMDGAFSRHWQQTDGDSAGANIRGTEEAVSFVRAQLRGLWGVARCGGDNFRVKETSAALSRTSLRASESWSFQCLSLAGGNRSRPGHAEDDEGPWLSLVLLRYTEALLLD